MLSAIRPHIALAATDVDATVAFYRALFGVEPVKSKPGYAKFSLQAPALNLSINKSDDVVRPVLPSHMGIEVSSTSDVEAWKARAEAAGLTAELEEKAVTCCYAVQDKFWLSDPDGHRWEVFVVHADADVHTIDQGGVATEEDKSCCPPQCCK